MGRARSDVHHPQTGMAVSCSVSLESLDTTPAHPRRLFAYHILLGMTGLSLYRASTIPPGSPHPRYAHPHAAEPDSDTEAEFRGISVAEWRRRRGEKPRAETEDDDLPLSAIKALDTPGDDVPDVGTPSPYPPPSASPISPENRLLRRWCKECQGWKPPRCHHCRTCGVCVLKVRQILSVVRSR